MFNLEFTVLTRIAYSLSKKEFIQMLLFKSGKREVTQWKSEGGLEKVFTVYVQRFFLIQASN